jgi:hypothetical protein
MMYTRVDLRSNHILIRALTNTIYYFFAQSLTDGILNRRMSKKEF